MQMTLSTFLISKMNSIEFGMSKNANSSIEKSQNLFDFGGLFKWAVEYDNYGGHI